jgi:hypothetical protein
MIAGNASGPTATSIQPGNVRVIGIVRSKFLDRAERKTPRRQATSKSLISPLSSEEPMKKHSMCHGIDIS